ncbi:hypothetical protein PGT21_032394 [Puccinia graminis f. sp. tritici]|uniref:Uncharacterized protein n=1 Tax=Puccinia graminis f. sp. tritici TaxID=56615 RepID=A0A5B0PZC5_PUCGR|nr:hypothetical protein PGT21_032394 [Puccinia graminis f. sp. tritici]KAA1109325.1 hypothetical protein PGTUg99_028769 [Puccinia graminis f. sp. tritici]
MEQESETAYKSLRQGLSSSSGINTVDEFFRLDVSKITTQLLLLGAEISKQLILLGTNILALYRGWVSNGYPTLERFALNHRVEPFKPLITVLLAAEGKSNQDIFEFINEAFNRPPTPLPVTPTPLRTGATSTLTNSSDQLSQFPPTPRQVWSSISSNISTPLWNPTKVSSIKSVKKLYPTLRSILCRTGSLRSLSRRSSKAQTSKFLALGRVNLPCVWRASIRHASWMVLSCR